MSFGMWRVNKSYFLRMLSRHCHNTGLQAVLSVCVLLHDTHTHTHNTAVIVQSEQQLTPVKGGRWTPLNHRAAREEEQDRVLPIFWGTCLTTATQSRGTLVTVYLHWVKANVFPLLHPSVLWRTRSFLTPFSDTLFLSMCFGLSGPHWESYGVINVTTEGGRAQWHTTELYKNKRWAVTRFQSRYWIRNHKSEVSINPDSMSPLAACC